MDIESGLVLFQRGLFLILVDGIESKNLTDVLTNTNEWVNYCSSNFKILGVVNEITQRK